MADADFSVYATVKANTTQFEQGMNKATSAVKSTNKVVDGLNSKLKSLFKSVGAVFAVSQIKKFTSESVNFWKYQDKQLNLLNTTLQSTGAIAWTSSKELTDFASSLQDVTNYGDEAIISMQNILLGFKNIKGDTFKDATKAILDMSTVMKMDLASAAQTVGKALDDPIKGLGSLSRQGFIFDEEQKKLIKTLVETGKTAEAQKIILDELNTTYGGAAEATSDVGEQLKNVWGDVKEKIGVALSGITDRFAVFMKDFLKNLNFDTFYNVFGNAYEMISTRVNQIMSKFKELAKSMKEFSKSEDFKPFLRLFDTIAGAIKKEIGNINNFIQGFAEGLRNLFSSIDSKKLEKVVNVIVTIIDVIYDVRDEIASVLSELQSVIFTALGNIWTRLKEVFTNSNNELANSEGNIYSWGEFIYEELNDVYKVFQDLMAHIKALLTGDWKLAWEYAKLATLRVIDSILTGIDTMLAAFPKITKIYTDSINWMIKGVNEVRSWFGEDPFNLVGVYKGSEKDPFGVTDLIKETEDEISKTTGDIADHDIFNLKGLSESSEGTIQNITAQFTKANDILISQRKERKDYFTQADEEECDSSKEVVQKTSEWNSKLLSQILDGLNEYDENYLDVKKQIINAEKEEAIAKAETEADKQKIALYYLGELEKAEEDYHKAVAEKYADDLKTVEDTKQKMIEESKEMRDKTISAFKEIGTASGKVFSYVGQSFVGVSKVIATTAKTVVKSSVEIFTSFKNTVVKSFTSIKSVVKESWESFKKITSFSIDDSLNSILEFEDSILTFFIETVPKLPGYLSSVFESVTVTIGSIIDSINFENLTTNINGIISSLADNLPVVVDKVLSTVQSLITTIINVVTENAPQIFALFDSVFEKMGTYFMDFIPDVINKLGRVVPVLITWIAEKASAVMNFLGDFMENLAEKINIEEILNNLITSIRNGVERVSESISTNLPRITKVIVEFLETAMEKLPALIDDILPKLLDILDSIFVSVGEVITAFVPKAIKILGEMLPTLITWVAGWIGNFINFLGNILEEISEKIDIEELIHNLAEAITKGLTSIGASIETSLPKMLSFLGTIVESIANELPAILKTALPIIISTISQMINFIAAELPKILDILLPAITEILDKNLPGLIESIVNLVVTIAGKLPDIIMDIFPTLLTGVVKLVETLVQKLPELLTSILDKLPELLQTIIKAVLDNLPVLVTAILTALPDIITSLLKGVFNLLHDLIFETDWGGVWEGIVNSFKAIWNGLGEFFKGLWDGISDWFDNFWDGIVNSLKEVWSGIGNFFSTIFDNLKKKVFEPFGTWFKTMWTNLKSWFKNLWDGFLDVMKAPINAIIKAINVVIDGLNKVSFSIPDWVPFVGGKKFGISIPNLQELAVGTENARKGLTLVGEAGPELVNFRGGEQVLNNHNTNKALENMGGTTINQNVTFNNLADTTAFAMLQQLKQYNRQMAINGIV